MKMNLPSMISARGAVICLFLLLCVASGFAGGKQDFTLHNQTGKTIKQIYVGPSNSDRFGEDVMGKNVVRDGGSVHITFHSAAPGNHWDLKIDFVDDTSMVWTSVDLSTIDDVTISYKDGKQSATWK